LSTALFEVRLEAARNAGSQHELLLLIHYNEWYPKVLNSMTILRWVVKLS